MNELNIVPGVPNVISLEALFLSVRDGKIALPVFQRSYVWSKEEKCLLLKSLCAELSIGSFILWKPEKKEPFKSILHFHATDPEFLILDGQQRLSFLSSLYFSAKSGMTSEDFDEFFIKFTDQKSFGIDIYTRKANTPNINRSANSKEEINIQRLIDKGVTELGSSVNAEQKDKLTTLLNRITGGINIYSINKPRPEALYLYQTCNMAGKPLKQIDLTEAVLSNQWEDLMSKVKDLSAVLSEGGKYVIFNNENILRCVSTGITLNFAQYDNELLDIFSPKAKLYKKNEYKIVELTEAVVKEEFKSVKRILLDFKSLLYQNLHFRSSEAMTLPSMVVSYILFKKFHSQLIGSEKRFKASFFKWFIFNIHFNHYTGGATNQKVNRDITDILLEESFDTVMHKLYRNIMINSSIQELKFNEFDFGLKGETSDIYAGLTFNKSKLSVLKQMAFTVACHKNAEDWYSTFRVKDFDRLELHHIFPKAKFKKTTYQYYNKLINHIANLAFITGKSNRFISSKLAEDYLWSLSNDHKGKQELLKQGIKVGTKQNELERKEFFAFCTKRAYRLTKQFNEYIDWLDSGMPDIAQSDYDLDMIRGGENNEVEFKSSFSFDYAHFEETGEKRANKEIEFEITKAVNAFANSQGGYLYIGVADNGEILGVENDLEVLDTNLDKLQNQIKDRARNAFQYFTPDLIILYTREYEGKKIIVVRALIAPNHPNEKVNINKKMRNQFGLSSNQEISFRRLGSSSGKQKYEFKPIVS